MKYLDNLIAWGDSLFLADTIETLNEATLCYVLAAQLLGPRPQSVPRPGGTTPRNFAAAQAGRPGRDGRRDGDPRGAVPVQPRARPRRVRRAPPGRTPSGVLFGIGRSLYFAIPPNPKLLGYWDTVADRLFKIRNSENIAGVVAAAPAVRPADRPGHAGQGRRGRARHRQHRQRPQPARRPGPRPAAHPEGPGDRRRGPLARRHPAVRPGEGRRRAARAAAAGPRGHPAAADAEHPLPAVAARDGDHQRPAARPATARSSGTPTTSACSARPRTRRRSRTSRQHARPTSSSPRTTSTTSTTRSSAEYDLPGAHAGLPDPQLAQGPSPVGPVGRDGHGPALPEQAGGRRAQHQSPQGQGRAAHRERVDTIAASAVALLPDVYLTSQLLGRRRPHATSFSGQVLSRRRQAHGATSRRSWRAGRPDQATIAARTAGYQRRADEWTLQANLAARELLQLGRQIVASLIAEQVA